MMWMYIDQLIIYTILLYIGASSLTQSFNQLTSGKPAQSVSQSVDQIFNVSVYIFVCDVYDIYVYIYIKLMLCYIYCILKHIHIVY